MHLRVFPARSTAKHTPRQGKHYRPSGVCLIGKTTEQKSDSLAEFREAHGDVAVSQLTVKPHPPQYKDVSRIMPGAVMDFGGTVGVLQGSEGFHNGTPDYYRSTKGEKVGVRRCVLLAQNTGMVFIPA